MGPKSLKCHFLVHDRRNYKAFYANRASSMPTHLNYSKYAFFFTSLNMTYITCVHMTYVYQTTAFLTIYSDISKVIVLSFTCKLIFLLLQLIYESFLLKQKILTYFLCLTGEVRVTK